jgi:tRNA(Ile)-lysidine synthase
VALSGGGDSVALLALTLDWARVHGRRVLALTVDHGLNPDSAAWTARAGALAHDLGADWRGLRWDGPKPAAGLPAAARGARHALIAEAAREAGACVVLFAHTLDDVRESALMRAAGSSLGRLREWAPSPAWPEGRGVFLLRPLLGVGRPELRALLRGRALDWIEDPANADLRFARPRARAALAGGAAAAEEAAEASGALRDLALATADHHGVLSLPRRPGLPPAFLSTALLCASGGARPPRGDALARLSARLEAGERFTATLAGARVDADARTVRVFREAGRAGLPRLRLEPGGASIWDGRFEIRADRPLEIAPLAGFAARLSQSDRAEIARLPAAARPTLPVVLGNPPLSPYLAWDRESVRSLAGDRLRAACGVIAHEREIAKAPRGAEPAAFLC